MCPNFDWVTTKQVAEELTLQKVRLECPVINVHSIDEDIRQAGSVNSGYKEISEPDLSLVQLARNNPTITGIMTRDSDFARMHAASLVPNHIKFWRPRNFYTAKRLFNWDFDAKHKIFLHPNPGFMPPFGLTSRSTIRDDKDRLPARQRQRTHRTG